MITPHTCLGSKVWVGNGVLGLTPSHDCYLAVELEYEWGGLGPDSYLAVELVYEGGGGFRPG